MKKLFTLIAAAGIALCAPLFAASDYYLKIDGIDGEAAAGTIEIQSFSWGMSNSGSAAGGGGGAGKVSFQDLHFTTSVNKASPLLMMACATGQHIKEAKLTVRKAGGGNQEYYVITLTDVLVSSYQSGGSNGGDRPMESLSLNFTKITYSYRPETPDGQLGPPVIGTAQLPVQ